VPSTSPPQEAIVTPLKFVLRYTAVPFTAIVAVVMWSSLHTSVEIDARQYASLSASYASFPSDLRHDIADAMESGKLSKSDYASLVRQTLDDGFVLDWPAVDGMDVANERAKLASLIRTDTLASQSSN
jgi:hypothetical protein